MRKHLKLAAIAALFVFNTRAQEKQNPVPEPIKKLYLFEGNWEGQAVMTTNGQPVQFKYSTTIKKQPGGWGLAFNGKGLLPDSPPYLEFGCLTTDVNDNMVHLFSVTNFGDVHDHKGQWTDDKNFKLQYSGTMDGKPMMEDLWVEVAGKDQWKIHDKVTVGGQVFQTLEVTMKRK